MLPYYTKQEIIRQVNRKIEDCNINEEMLIDDFNIDHTSLKKNSIWSVHDYKSIAAFLGVPVEHLAAVHSSENLQNISFRAEENTEEIKDHVRKLDDIFINLAYQIKIGGDCDDR